MDRRTTRQSCLSGRRWASIARCVTNFSGRSTTICLAISLAEGTDQTLTEENELTWRNCQAVKPVSKRQQRRQHT
jgi:hypothetical protein